MGIALNPTETDIAPDTHLSQIRWHSTVAARSRIRLGDTQQIKDECKDPKKRKCACAKGECDAIDYMRYYDADGTKVGDVWKDGSPSNFANTVCRLATESHPIAAPRAPIVRTKVHCCNPVVCIAGKFVPKPCCH